MAHHQIPIERHWNPAFFGSSAHLLIEGAIRRGNDPGGWRIMGWVRGTVNTNPRGMKRPLPAPGPYVGAFEHWSRDPGPDGLGPEHAEAEAAGLLFRCKHGDTFTIDGNEYTLWITAQGTPRFVYEASPT